MRHGLLGVMLVLGGCAEPEALVFTARPIALGVGVSSTVLVEDLDGDGRGELVGLSGAGLSVRRVEGERFGERTVYSLPGNAAGLVVADVDGDGRLDVAAGIPSRRTLAWLAGGEDGLAPVREIAVGAEVRTMVAGDVDGDGIDELIVSVADEEDLMVVRGDRGVPAIVQRLRVGEIGGLAVGDLDRDGRVEVAVVVPARGELRLLRVDEDGLLGIGAVVWQADVPSGVVIADVDGDGALDLAASDLLGRQVWVALGDGVGGWRSREAWDVEMEPGRLLARRGPDGPELIVVGPRSLWRFDPRSGEVRARTGVSNGAYGLVAVDLEGDGVDELVREGAVLRDVVGEGLVPRGEPVGPATSALLRADLDGQGDESLVALEVDRGELVAYAIDGGDLLERSRAAAPASLQGTRALARSDGGSDVAWWSTAGFGVVAGDGLEPGAEVALAQVLKVVPMHLDDDGEQDLAVVVGAYERVRGQSRRADSLVLTTRAGDEWSEPVVAYEGGQIVSVVVAQIDDDALDDVWVADDRGVVVLRSSEGWMPTPAAVQVGLTGAEAVDLDGDGALDLAGCDAAGRGVFAVYGLGDGTFGSAEQLSTAACTQLHSCVRDDEAPLLAIERSLPGYFAILEILHAVDGGWVRGGSMDPGLAVSTLAVDYVDGDLSVWTGGGRGLGRVDLVAGPALVEQGPLASAVAILLGDLDGDDRDDLVADGATGVTLARVDAAGEFGPAVSRAWPSEATRRVVGLGDFVGAGGVELLVAEVDVHGISSHAVWALRDDRLARIDTIAVRTWDAIGDFDGDGRDELLSFDDDWPALVGPGGTLMRLERTLFRGLGEVRAVDMDGDGRSDLLASEAETDVYSASALHLLRSTGDGFGEPRILDITAAVDQLGTGDLDHDGALDLVSIAPYASRTVCLGGAAGPAARCETTAWSEAPQTRMVVVEDLDEDGDPDVAVGASSFDADMPMQVWRGDGAGGLEPEPPQTTVAGTLRRARLGDGANALLMLGSGQAYRLTRGTTP